MMFLIFDAALIVYSYLQSPGSFWKDGGVYYCIFNSLLLASYFCIGKLAAHWKNRAEVVVNLERNIVRAAIYVATIGSFLQYMWARSWNENLYEANLYEANHYMKDMVICLVLSIISYYLTRTWIPHLSTRVVRGFGFVCCLLTVALLAIAHMYPPIRGTGAHLKIAGVMVTPIVQLLFLFGNYYINTNRKFRRQILHILALIYAVIIIVFCVWNRDLGFALIIGGVTLFQLLPMIYHSKGKVLSLCVAVLIVVISLHTCSATFQTRMRESALGQFFTWSNSAEREESRESESTQKLRESIQNGWYGNGYGKLCNLSNQNTDYIIVLLLSTMGIFFFGLVLVLYAHFLILQTKTLWYLSRVDERILVNTCNLLFIVPSVYILLSSLGYLPFTGIVTPFLSDGTTSNISYAILLGITTGCLGGEK